MDTNDDGYIDEKEYVSAMQFFGYLCMHVDDMFAETYASIVASSQP
jgi:hypothetical protein